MTNHYLKEKKILLVDDQADLLEMTADFLRQGGYQKISTAQSAEEALELVKKTPPDLAILDIMLPDMNGFDLMKRLREKQNYPILFLSARGEAEDRLRGYDLGADDYVVKPFLAKELLYKITAILRRAYPKAESRFDLVDCQVDLEAAEVIRGQDRTRLTAKEVALLRVLYRNEGKIVTIDNLCQAVWGDNPFAYEEALMTHVRRVRKKIEANPSQPQCLVTAKGLGYKLLTKGHV